MGFEGEQRLLDGEAFSTSDRASVVCFTTHRSASTFLNGLLTRMGRMSGMPRVDFAGYLYSRPRNPDHERRVYEEAALTHHATGYIYGPYRRMVRGIPPGLRIFLLLRDPRDVLTSYYYSAAYSHGTTWGSQAATEWLLAQREQALGMTIDDFVLSQDVCDKFVHRYEAYRTELLDRPDVKLMRYERLVTDFPGWLADMVEFCGLPIGPLRRWWLARTVSFEVTREDPHAHKRQVTPGDHRRKLKPETIAALDERFAPTLRRLGYE